MPFESELVRLREERPSDRALFLTLRNDMATQGWNKALPPDYTEYMEQQRYEKREHSFDRSDARFVIEVKADGSAIGYISYTGLWPRMSASIGISTLQSAWGSSAAFDAQEVLVRFLFLDLGLRVVRLWTNGANDRGMRLAARSGFQVAIRMRESCYKDGQLCDTVMMDMLREEYFERHPELDDALPPIEAHPR